MKKLLIVVILLLLILIVINLTQDEKQYTFIEYTVKAGDTLWNLASKYGADYTDIRKTVDIILKDNFFFSTRENIEENTGLSSYQQRSALGIL